MSQHWWIHCLISWLRPRPTEQLSKFCTFLIQNPSSCWSYDQLYLIWPTVLEMTWKKDSNLRWLSYPRQWRCTVIDLGAKTTIIQNFWHPYLRGLINSLKPYEFNGIGPMKILLYIFWRKSSFEDTVFSKKICETLFH